MLCLFYRNGMRWNSVCPSHSFFEIMDGLPLSQVNPAAPVKLQIDLVRVVGRLRKTTLFGNRTGRHP
jgi:hypothetical protein